MSTPQEALHLAHAWQQYAATQVGPARDEALRVAAHWYGVHQLSVAPPATLGPPGHVPYPAHAPQQTFPGYQQPAPQQYAHPGYQQPAPQQYAHPQPAQPYSGYQDAGQEYSRPAYPAPGLVPRRRGLRPRTIGTLLVLAVVLGTLLVGTGRGVGERIIASTFGGGWTGAPGVEPNVPSAFDGEGTGSGEGFEAAWKAGTYASELPDPVPSSSEMTPFLPDQPDPTQWLVERNPANEGIQVVFTDDEDLNCGMRSQGDRDSAEHSVAGCFNPDHPLVLFIYWHPASSPEARQLILAHELSHLMQWWQQFDVMYSAHVSGLGDDEAWVDAIESDATCRVLSWGGYSEAVANRSSSPCTTDDWSEGWLEERAVELGVTVTDH